MASVYELLCQAKPLDKEEERSLGTKKANSDGNGKNKVKSKTKVEAKDDTFADEIKEETFPPTNDKLKTPRFSPSIHIDVQIHISPESSAEQINQIFESMGKHLGKLANGTNE